MKNKFVLIILFVLIFFALMPRPVTADMAPPYIVSIIVINSPSDLQLSARYIKSSVTETKVLERRDVAWESEFRLMDYYFWRDYKLYSNGMLIVKSKDYNFELSLPDEIFYKFGMLYTLDLESQTLSEGKPAWQAPVSISLQIIVTLLLESIVFYLFGYREKRSWIIFFIVNLITQSVLYIGIRLFGIAGYGIIFFWYGAIGVFIIELIAFALGLKEQNKWKAISYAFFGNLLSLILGNYLLAILPT